MTAALLEVSELTVRAGEHTLLDRVSFTVRVGESVAVVGPSGAGKSVLALAVAGLLPAHLTVSGSILLDGQSLLTLKDRELAAIRGDRIGVVFQEPKLALNPVVKLGRQITEALNIHYQLTRAQREARALELATQVGLDDAERILSSYPHEVSGGQRQRVAIAAAISAAPELLIADEATSALDTTVQAEVLALLRRLHREQSLAMLFVTHDLAVAQSIADQVIVLSAGRVVEYGALAKVLAQPQDAVTRELIEATRASSLVGGVTDD